MVRFRVTSLASLALVAWAATAHAGPVLGPRILLSSDTPYAGHGVTGDEALLFNVEIQPPDIDPTGTRVAVYARGSKEKVGELPPVGPYWAIPMNIFLENYWGTEAFTMGTVMVLEVGLVPNAPPAFMRLIRYAYSYSHRQGFHADVLDVGDIPVATTGPSEFPNGVGLPVAIDVAVAGDGSRHVVLADSFNGTVWSTPVDDLHAFQMVLAAPELAATLMTSVCYYNGEPLIGLCGYARGPNWSVEYYVQQMWQPVPGLDLSPGSFGMAYIGKTGKVAFNNSGDGHIYQIDAAVLLDPTLPPYAKPLSVLVDSIPGVSDMQGSLAWDRWHPNSEWLYWQRIIANPDEGYYPIYRVNVLTGEVERVAESVYLFDHPSIMAAIPPRRGQPFTVIATSNTQERNMAFTNVLVSESRLVAPSVATETRIWLPPRQR